MLKNLTRNSLWDDLMENLVWCCRLSAHKSTGRLEGKYREKERILLNLFGLVFIKGHFNLRFPTTCISLDPIIFVNMCGDGLPGRKRELLVDKSWKLFRLSIRWKVHLWLKYPEMVGKGFDNWKPFDIFNHIKKVHLGPKYPGSEKVSKGFDNNWKKIHMFNHKRILVQGRLSLILFWNSN